MAKWIRGSDGDPVLDTSDLQLSKSMRLLGTDLGQQLLEECFGKEYNYSNDACRTCSRQAECGMVMLSTM